MPDENSPTIDEIKTALCELERTDSIKSIQDAMADFDRKLRAMYLEEDEMRDKE